MTTTKLEFFHQNNSEEVGMMIIDREYAYLSLQQDNGQLYLRMVTCKEAERGALEEEQVRAPLDTRAIYLRVNALEEGKCQFSFSTDNILFRSAGSAFYAREGKWIGVKVGLFSIRERHINNGGYTNFDWFRFSK